MPIVLKDKLTGSSKTQPAKPEISKPVKEDNKSKREIAKSKTESSVTRLVQIKLRPKRTDMLVPPPPPDTPTMLSNMDYETTNLMSMGYISPELLKKRKQDLVAQMDDAKSDLKHKQDDAQSVKEKAVQFKTLFEEGVISKRELEAAEKEANDVDLSINRAQLRVSELQTSLDAVNGRWNQVNKKQIQHGKKQIGSSAVKKLSVKADKIH